MRQIELENAERLFGRREWMAVPDDVPAEEMVEGYLSTLRADETNNQRHSYRKLTDDRYEIRDEKVGIAAKYRRDGDVQ